MGGSPGGRGTEYTALLGNRCGCQGISDLIYRSYTPQKGSYVAIYVREADDWKIRMAYAN
jgi:hypothetical protein